MNEKEKEAIDNEHYRKILADQIDFVMSDESKVRAIIEAAVKLHNTYYVPFKRPAAIGAAQYAVIQAVKGAL